MANIGQFSAAIKQNLQRTKCTVGGCGEDASRRIQYGEGGFIETTCRRCFDSITATGNKRTDRWTGTTVLIM